MMLSLFRLIKKVLVHENYGKTKCWALVDRWVSVLLNCTEEGEVTLYISYLVFGASWTPKYDIRAFIEDQVVKVKL